MNKALKAAISARHEKSRPDLVLPAQYPRLDPNKIAVHTGKDARTTFLYSMSQLNSRMMLEGAFRAHLYTEAETNKETDPLEPEVRARGRVVRRYGLVVIEPTPRRNILQATPGARGVTRRGCCALYGATC